MVNYNVAIRTTLLLVDDDLKQLEVRSLALRMSGFTVLAASNPLEAISMLAQAPVCKVDVAVLDYEMPVMTGCVLADYLRARYPQMGIILHSGAIDIPESEMKSIDTLVAKGEGVARLVEEVSNLAELGTMPMGTMSDEGLPASWA